MDASALRICQLDADQWRQSLCLSPCDHVVKHQNEYFEIEHDNPNLIWLYTLLLKDEVKLSEGPVIWAMKKRLLSEDHLTSAAWRYIANGTANDFRPVLDSFNPGNEPQWRYHLLLWWLQILSSLRLKAPIPEPIQAFFVNDNLTVEPQYGEVHFHGAWIKFATLRHILKEAENRLEAGALQEFADAELVDVITWLTATAPTLDNNQRKKGWRYLHRRATDWKSEIELRASYEKLRWFSVLPQLQIDQWTIDPVIDAWSLHRLAISQRHCADRFIKECVDGNDRFFTISNSDEKILATVRLTFTEYKWRVDEVRGFANADVAPEISQLGNLLAQYYI